MDIEIPPWLQWVSYLAGGEWPQGSESGMVRIGEHFQVAAAGLEDLIPDLNRVRQETLSVLFGETAQAADEQFAMLFDGDYTVDKLVKGISALGELAGSLGTEIEYSKLSILVGLALAAVEISWALAAAPETLGGSLSVIPITEMLTTAAIRRLVAEVMRRLAATVREILTRTMVKRLLLEGGVEALQELGFGLAQETIVQGIQIANGHRDGFDGERILQTVKGSLAGGAAGGTVAPIVAHGLGPAGSKLAAAVKGTTVFFSAGVVGGVVGATAVGGELSAASILGPALFSSLGGLRGAGLPNGRTTALNVPIPGRLRGEGPRPMGSPSNGPLGSDPATGRPHPSAAPSSGSNGNGHAPSRVDGASVSDSPTSEPVAHTAAEVNEIAAQPDTPAHTVDPTADNGEAQTSQPETHADDEARHTEPSATHTNDGETRTEEPATHTNDGETRTEEPATHTNDAETRTEEPATHTNDGETRTVGDGPAHQQPAASPVADAAETQNADVSDDHARTDVDLSPAADHGPKSEIEPTTERTSASPPDAGPMAPPADPAPASSTDPVSGTSSPALSVQPSSSPPPSTPATAAPHTQTQTPGPNEKTPTPGARRDERPASQIQDHPEPRAGAQSTSNQPAAPPAARRAATTAAGEVESRRAGDDDSATVDTPGADEVPDHPSAEEYRAAAEQVLADHAARDWGNVSDEQLAQMLRHGDEGDAMAAVIEVVRREEGKTLRWTQVMATMAMRDAPVNMDAGEGKSLVFLAYAAREAVDHGSVQVFTTRDTLANREFDRYVKVLGKYGYDIVRMNPDAPHPDPVEGKPTIYLGTQNDAGFGILKDHPVPGNRASIDEIDEALVHADTNYILSEGAGQQASPEVAAEAVQADVFLDEGLHTGALTEGDFGRDPGQVGGPAALTDAGRAKAEEMLGRELTDNELKRLNMAATARWEYIEGDHYAVHDGKVFIIDQTTHKVMFDPETSTESRWNGGLAQAIEAKHGLAIRDDPNTSKSVTATKMFSSENYDSLTGASGTAEGVAVRLERDYGMKPVITVPRFEESRLQIGDDRVAPDQATKHQDIARDVAAMQNSGRPQLVICNRNSEVAKLSGLLTDSGVDHVAVDAAWFLEHGVDAEADLQAIFDEAGQSGKVLVINRQGGRGVDIPVSDEVNARGGLHVLVTSRSAESRDVDVQAENRAARSGQNGSAQYYTSPEDALYQQLSHNPDVELAVIRYTDAVAEHAADPSAEHRAKIETAAQGLRELTPGLQETAAHGRFAPKFIGGQLPNAPPDADTEQAPEADAAEPRHPPPDRVEPSPTTDRHTTTADDVSPERPTPEGPVTPEETQREATPDSRTSVDADQPAADTEGTSDFVAEPVSATHDDQSIPLSPNVNAADGGVGRNVGDGSHHDDADPGQRWQHVQTPEGVANGALARRGLEPQEAHKLRHPLGVSEAARELGRYRAQDNAAWWNALTGAQQRALIDTYPQHIGNAEGIPADARDVANRLTLERDRAELQARRDRGERLTGRQREQLARYDRIQAALDRSANDAKRVGGPLLLAFDPFAFGGDGRAVVSFGHDPYKADSVSVHVPGRGMDIDQIGPTMGDALKQLQSTLREDPNLKASSIAWIGYDTASGWKGLRAAGRSFARTGGAMLCGDIQAFNAVRATPAAIHIFGHSYGSTTTAYAAKDGRMRGQVKTITLVGSPGAGPLKNAGDAGIGADNVYVASSSRDPYTTLGGRTRRSFGRIFGYGLGMDPAMESFGAQRIAAEFSAEMDSKRTNFTHNAYYRYVDRTADPPVRSESLANFGRIAAGKPVDTDPHRTIDERPWYRLGWRTVEPVEGRPLRLADDTTGDHAGDRDTRRWWNPHWRAQSGGVEPQGVTAEETPAPAGHDPDHDGGSHTDDSDDPGQRWKHVSSQEDSANAALAQRGLTPEQAHKVRNPLGLMEAACERAADNTVWWDGLTGAQQRALIETYPQHIGNAEGIPADARDAANRIALEQDRKDLKARRDRGERLTRPQRKQLARLGRIQAALDRAAGQAADAKVGKPRLLAFDPYAFGGDGRAVVSLGADPYQADSVSVHVPGVAMTIDELGPSIGFALNHLQSTLHENPNLKASSIVWLGYDTPSGPWQAASDRRAREGAKILYSDIRAFNTVRDTPAAIHVFAHSYGSVTASYAGRDGRLANDIRTVSLIGSPGAGPLNSADEFGPDVDVYVASSSRDPIAALGGRTEGSRGRIFGRGRGIDPAMQSFGAQRITAEFSAGMDRWRRNMGTHNAYYSYVDRTAGVRSESLANFGRIAAGKPADTEQHRTIRERPLRRPHIRTVEPAQGRPLQLADDTTGDHAGDRARRRLWNPLWLRPIAPDETPHTPTVDNPPETATLVKAALEARGVGPDEWVSPADHRVPQDQAVARAEANAEWWKSLSDPDSDEFSDVQWGLIRAYPFQIGNAEGIPPMARHEANAIMLQQWLTQRDVLLSRRDNGVAINAKQERFLELMNDIESALRSAERNAARANVGGPYLLALDPQAFNGVGRAIVSFGADPYTAKSVSWYVPGMSTTIEKLRGMMLRSFNTLQSTLRENTDPDFTAAAVTYIGYEPPGSWDPRVGFQKMAREGGEIFASDMLSFNAGREIITGSRFSNNHVFAHSYGSSTVSHAGHRQRLAGQVQTITLIGSPGAGPLQHARDFGIGEENVFVAASSRDRTTGLGGDRPGERGRTISRMGQGIDPAMDSFGARRITAEFPAALDHMGRGSRMTHSIYWAYMDPGLNPRVRSESLTNFGRIAAGHANLVDTEGHRTLRERRRWLRKPVEITVEPARGRPLRLKDDPTTHHPVDRRHYWNPRFRAQPLEFSSVEVNPVEEDLPSPAELPAADVGDIEQGPVPDRVVADLALEDRGVGPDDLVSPADHRVPQDQAVARAKANAEWWKTLSDPDFDGFSNAQWALIRAYPFQIGNAEGIPPMARHEANSIMLQRWLAHRDVLLSRRDNGVALNAKQEQFLELMNGIESALRSGTRNASRASVGGPYLLALDPRAFDGVGRAIVSFGADPYTAKSVSWYVPGMSTTIEKLRTMMLRSFNTLQSTLRENIDPDFTAASITYLGYKPPGSWDPRVGFQKMARDGGEIFASDMLSFNVGRDIFTGDGSHFSNHHVFAHSYGSSTVSHAGHGQRLAGQVQTITLIGSPGAGPLQHARDFGVGEENVFVAASSRDRTTGLGGERPGERGRTIRRMGQGIDPAMDSFGARRITAEFPAALDQLRGGSRMTHSIYWAYMDPGLNPQVRSESLTNFGRIAAGRANRVDREGHRTLSQRTRLWRKPIETTVEPAIGRPLRIADDPTIHRPINGRNYWNPRFLRDIDCGHGVMDELSALHPELDFTLDAAPSPKGVPAWKLFRAIGSRSQFATFAQIESRLKKLGHGSKALLASRWRGRGRGGHAYLAMNVHGKIKVFDPHHGEWTDWPPPWSENSIRRTAVGYLKANGEPVERYAGSTRDLAAASFIGRVQGHPDSDAVANALAQRMPRVGVADLVSPLGFAELAAARAELNAIWWSALSPEERVQLLKAHPYEIGNAEGVFPEHRSHANHLVLQGYRRRAAEYQARLDNGERLDDAKRRFVQRVNGLDVALQEATAAAARAGLDPPLLLAFDPRDFGGNGRALISFGTDPSQAGQVSWHTTKQPIEQLGTGLRSVLDELASTREEAPTAAAIICVGKEASKLRLPWDFSRKPGPDGVLNSDLAAFRAARTAWESTGDGAPLTTNRVHSVRGSSTRTGGLRVPPEAGSLVAAHRGASHEFPEQTLAAYEEALRQGADGLECDIRLTKDGHIVCIHDKRVDRTSNGTGLVGDMTLAELRALDFGGWHPSRNLGDAQGDTGILTLERLIGLVQNQDRPVTLFVEVKEHNGTLTRALVELLNRHGLTNPTSTDQARVAVISFYPDALLRVRHLAPNLPTVQLGPALLGPGTRLLASTVGATAIGPSIQTLRANPELVELAASQGLDTYCWTVNDQRDVQYARDLGVHWIATDHPGRTNRWLQGEPTRPPAPETIELTSEPGGATVSQVAVEETPVLDTEPAPAKPAFVHELSETEARAFRVEEALAQRKPRVRPDELRNPVDMLDSNPSDMADEASARARNNAVWWKELTPEQRQDLIEAYPQHIGNAEGIPPKDRDAANQIVLEELRNQRDRVLDKIHHFKLPSLKELKLLRRVNRLDVELRKASADAKRANVDGPLLLAFDPAEFGGDGRAVLSFGHDPYDADSVSVHVPGVATTVHSRYFFGFYASNALNHLVSTRQENPNLKAASIAWIGYDTPSGRKLPRMAKQELARAAGELLYSDIRSLSEGRTTWNDADARTPQIHVFGYSYGSTATAHAGVRGRLAEYVSTVSLLGSPGAGPLQNASEFGLEDGKVFVASSSRDLVTGLGGRTERSKLGILAPIGRIFGLGLGIDPAMKSFGAVRVTAEVPVAMNRPHILGTHDTYYQFANPGGDSRVRSEALANFGRIAAGRTERLHLERHRTEGDRRGLLRTVDPAGERSIHRIGNPAWLRSDSRQDPELLQRQADYRDQDPATRRADTRYAEPLGDVVDNAGDMDSARRLADDLSGVYGPFRIRLEAERFGTELRLTGVILYGDTEIGNIQRILDRDSDGKLVAYHTGVSIKEEFADLRGQGFSKALTAELERYYVRCGVDRIEVWTHDKGANIWARRGFTWNPDSTKLQESLNNIKRAAETLSSHVSAAARSALDEMVQRLESDHPRLPEPIEIAHLATPDEPNLGRRLLESVGLRSDGGVHLVRYLPVETEVLTSQPRKGFRALLQRWFGLGADHRSLGEPDCGRGVVGAYARRYGRDVAVPVARSRTGLPAWAVFEATGSGSRFATDDEVFAELQRLGPGSSAILASRWSGGRWGGHIRFAINDGGRIYVEECYNEQRSERLGWPPQGAVSQTAVGYFDSDGNPVRPLHDVPLQLGAADAIGDVKGVPADPEFHREQAKYRDQDPTTRPVDTRYADPLGVVLDNAFHDPNMADQLAEDLSGVYGPCRVEMTQEHFDAGDPMEQLEAITEGIPLFEASIYGDIVSGDETVGTIHWRINRDKLGVLVVEHRIYVDKEFPVKEFTDAVTAQLEPYLQRSGVVRIESTTYGHAAYAAAVRGETWNPDPLLLEQSLNEAKRSARGLLDQVSDSEAKDLLTLIMWRMDPTQPDIPQPVELAHLSTRAEPDLGRRLLEGTGIRDLDFDEIRSDTELHTLRDLRETAIEKPRPVRTVPGDPELLRRQGDYRAQDRATRRVDTRCAVPLDDVFDGPSAVADQLAEDLSGVYGQHRVELEKLGFSGQRVVVGGPIRRGEHEIGHIAWIFARDDAGKHFGHYELHLHDDIFEGTVFSKAAVIAEMLPYAMRSGIDHITSTTQGNSAYVVADLGDTWDPHPDRLQASLDNIERSARELWPDLSDDGQRVVEQVLQRLDPAHPRLPEPIELAALETRAEPDLGRRLLEGTRLADDGTGVHYVKYLWNPRLHSGQNCGSWSLEQLSARYGIRFALATEPSARGVHARALFEAIGSRADFMSYSEVEELLSQMDPGPPGGPGPAALLTSSWAGSPSRGGHAYLAFYDGGRVYLQDAFTGERLDWPPYWGEGAVSRTAVGILNAHGKAVQRLDSSPDPLVAADEIGHVQGPPSDPDFLRQQAEYRARELATRRVDTRYAEPLGDVLDNASDVGRVGQLAEDLSGIYPPYPVLLQDAVDDDVGIGGYIYREGQQIGNVYWTFRRDEEGKLVVDLGLVEIENSDHRGQGFSKSLASILLPYFQRCGVDRIEVTAGWQGAYVWAKWGLVWNPDPAKLQESLRYITRSANKLLPTLNDEGKQVIQQIIDQLQPGNLRLPSPIELARLAAPGHPNLGRDLLEDSYWHGAMYLGEGEA